MLTMKPLFPVRCLQAPATLWPEPTPADLIPPDVPSEDGPLGAGGPLAVVRWDNGQRQWVRVLYEDALLDEAKVRFWNQVPGWACAVEVERWVPLARLEGRR